jgi:hypothetical protein
MKVGTKKYRATKHTIAVIIILIFKDLNMNCPFLIYSFGVIAPAFWSMAPMELRETLILTLSAISKVITASAKPVILP